MGTVFFFFGWRVTKGEGRGRQRLISTRTVLGWCNYALLHKGATSEVIDASRAEHGVR